MHMKNYNLFFLTIFIGVPLAANDIVIKTPDIKKSHVKGIAKIAAGVAWFLFGKYGTPLRLSCDKFGMRAWYGLKLHYSHSSLSCCADGMNMIRIAAWLGLSGYAIYDGLDDLGVVAYANKNFKRLRHYIKKKL